MRTCLCLALFLAAGAFLRADDWPQWLGPQRDGEWREDGLLERFPKGGPKRLWRTPLGTGYSGPAVAGERVYVMDFLRDRDKDGKPARPTRDGIPGRERVVCLDAKTGKPIWDTPWKVAYTISYPSGPRVTPLVRDGKVYALGAMGKLVCLRADNGKGVWSRDLMADYKLDNAQAWGWAAHPLLDGERLVCLVGGPGSAVVAFHKDTGKELWKGLTSEEVGYSPPTIFTLNGRRQLVIWLSEAIHGLDPATGKLLWKHDYPEGRPPQRPSVNIAQVRQLGDQLFLSSFYHGPRMLRIKEGKEVETVWRGKSDFPPRRDGLHTTMAAPLVRDGHLYGVCIWGELRCIDAATGKQRWETFDYIGGKKADCGTAFLIPNGDRTWIFNDSGDLYLTRLTPRSHETVGKVRIVAPDHRARGREVVWSHPAFAHRCIFARNDSEIVCVSLAAAKE